MVEYVNFEGKSPHLCFGPITYNIDGEIVKFGAKATDDDRKCVEGNLYPPFWKSGGIFGYSSEVDNFVVLKGDWKFNKDKIPAKYAKYADQLIEIFKAAIPLGCCGGCMGK